MVVPNAHFAGILGLSLLVGCDTPHLCILMHIMHTHVLHEVRHALRLHAFVGWSLRANTGLTFRVHLERSSDKEP